MEFITTDAICFDRTYFGTDGVIFNTKVSECGLGELWADVKISKGSKMVDDKEINIVYTILDGGNEVASASLAAHDHIQKVLDINSPILWDGLDNTHLYTAKATLMVDGKEALEKLHEKCDVAVVSSANPEAVKDEWDRYGLTEHVDILCTQDMGSKAHCISELLKKGYKVNNVLMCGDAVGDMKAAAANGVLYYPICVNYENESWEALVDNAYPRFINSSYKGDYQKEVIDNFLDNLR